MKNKLLIVLAVSALTATSAYAAVTALPTAGVKDSVHDMNVVEQGVRKDAQGRVCAFCHTPHHASVDPLLAGEYNPLWAHEVTQQVFTQYDSETFDANNVNAIDPLYGPSRLCMSCHDGAIAPDQHYGSANDGVKFAGNEFTGATWQIGIGANSALNRTHPIGFNLADAVAQDAAGSNASGVAGFVANVATTAVYLGGGSKTIASQLYNGFMTCATCHDVHNKDNVVNNDFDAEHPDTVGRNYLVFAKQAGSQLCLSCHNK